VSLDDVGHIFVALWTPRPAPQFCISTMKVTKRPYCRSRHVSRYLEQVERIHLYLKVPVLS